MKDALGNNVCGFHSLVDKIFVAKIYLFVVYDSRC